MTRKNVRTTEQMLEFAEDAGRKVDSVPILRSVVGSLTGRAPTSMADAAGMDVTDAGVGLIPVVGDLFGLVRTFRYAFGKQIPSELKKELVIVSLLDVAVGIVPGAGDVADLAFASNIYTYKRLQKTGHIEALQGASGGRVESKRIVKKQIEEQAITEGTKQSAKYRMVTA